MGVSATHTLLSHDGSSCARRPLTLTSYPPTRSCHTGQRHAISHANRGRVAKSVFKCCSMIVSDKLSGESAAGRFSCSAKEGEHVTKQPANAKECVSGTIQLLSGHRIPNEMKCVTCDWCDVLMRGSWEESLPFSPCLSLGAVLPPLAHRDP